MTFREISDSEKNAIHILVVDDDDSIGEIITSTAEALGFRCSTANSARDFMNMFSHEFTLLVVDLLMPDIDGVELLRWLAEQNCNAGILLVSGMDKRVLETAEILARSLGLAVLGHLQKPFRIARLEVILADCASRAARAEPDRKATILIDPRDIEGAIARNEFILHYQPQIDITTGQTVGVEALVRWRHPDLGLVYPDAFIGVAESSGLIDELGWLVVNRALAEVRRFTLSSARTPTLSINVSTHSLTNLKFPDRFVALTEKYGVPPESTILEITESGLFENLSSALDILMRLRMKGVQLSIDDFGTGYAMMDQLQNVPATELKIDKSFVHEMHQKVASRVLVQKTIEIAHELGMKVIAEGVETAEQLDYLRSRRCDLAQGYLFSRPLPMLEAIAWLKNSL